jgi:phosphoglycerol transferase
LSRHFFFYFLAFFLVGFSRWVGNTFGDPSIDQILYHLHYSESAAVQMGEIFIFTLLAEVLLFPFMFALIASLLHGAAVRAWPQGAALVRTLPKVALVAAVSVFLAGLSAFSYAAAYFAPDRFSEQYVDPRGVRLEAGKLRNLVLIYVESLEESYGDPGRFGKDLLAPLRAVGGQSFTSYRQAPGATWTMAGMVATQCGVPLRVYSQYDIKPQGSERSFMPGALCLGDLLQAHGFHNVFMGGAPLSFAGKGTFLRDHGYGEVHGLDEWKLSGVQANEQNEWGLYDSALYARARARLEKLHASGQPFNLTLLTLDTHNPHGFMSPYCRGRGARNFEGIVSCASEQLADFVRFMREKGYLDNTVVVILGDHLAVPNPVYEKLEQGDRRIFNLFLSPQPLARNTEELLPFDMFPTLAEMIGFSVLGDRLGLGYSAVSEVEVPRPAERLKSLTFPTLSGSAGYNNLWQH